MNLMCMLTSKRIFFFFVLCCLEDDMNLFPKIFASECFIYNTLHYVSETRKTRPRMGQGIPQMECGVLSGRVPPGNLEVAG